MSSLEHSVRERLGALLQQWVCGATNNVVIAL